MLDFRKGLLATIGVSLCGVGIISIIAIASNSRYSISSSSVKPDTFVMFNDIDGTSVEEFATEPVIEVLDADQDVADMSNKCVIEIPELDIEAPIHEGIDDATLSVAVGHFPDCGKLGEGNYCLAAHSSDFYECIFNNLKDVKMGMRINLYSKKGVCYTYYVTENFVVDPEEVWVVDDFGDNRVTLVTCTDGGNRRQIVVGLLLSEDEYNEYLIEHSATKRTDILNVIDQVDKLRVSDYFDAMLGVQSE